MVVQEIEASSSVRSVLLPLSEQHKRFVKAGEVSKEYLKFLWRRDMKLGQGSQEAQPLEMSEDDIRVIVGSLLHIRFMYRVRDGPDAFLQDRFVVASCLANKAGPQVDAAKILELKPGCAIHSRMLKLVGAHAVPPGLVTRFLAPRQGASRNAGSDEFVSTSRTTWCCCMNSSTVMGTLGLSAT